MSEWFRSRLRMLVGSRHEMSCREVGAVLQTYLDSELDEHRSAALAAHLEACKNCGLEASIVRQVTDNLASLETPVPTEVIDRLRVFSNDLVTGGS